MDLGKEVNIIYPIYTIKFGFYTSKIDIGIQKIDGFYLDIFEIIITKCLIKNKIGNAKFFL